MQNYQIYHTLKSKQLFSNIDHCTNRNKNLDSVYSNKSKLSALSPATIPASTPDKKPKLGMNNSSSKSYKTEFRRPLGKVLSSIVRHILGFISRWIMMRRNKTYLHDENHTLERLVFDRDSNIGLLTISNHCSIFDDPGIWCGILPAKKLNLDNYRHTIMDEGWFSGMGKFGSNLFHSMNCLPIKRGDRRGLESPQLDALRQRLMGKGGFRNKQWCHLMIEGRILQAWRFDPVNKPRLGKFRLGSAKLIATTPPSQTVVLPIFHDGMHNIFPETPPENPYDLEKGLVTNASGKSESFFPAKGKRVDVFVGQPIDFSDIVPSGGLPFEQKIDRSYLNRINDRLFKAMLELEGKAAHERKMRLNSN